MNNNDLRCPICNRKLHVQDVSIIADVDLPNATVDALTMEIHICPNCPVLIPVEQVPERLKLSQEMKDRMLKMADEINLIIDRQIKDRY